jgi:hypothetical protein
VGFNRGHFFSALVGVMVGVMLVAVLPAAADDGDNLILGETNTATSPTKVWARRGVLFRASKVDTPAATFLVRSGPPFAVESTGLVDNLNADYLDGNNAEWFVRDFVDVTDTFTGSVPASTNIGVGVQCPDGRKIIGGGYEMTGNLTVTGSGPDPFASDTGWAIFLANRTGGDVSYTVKVYGFCARV